jgi:hypothetical protein
MRNRTEVLHKREVRNRVTAVVSIGSGYNSGGKRSAIDVRPKHGPEAPLFQLDRYCVRDRYLRLILKLECRIRLVSKRPVLDPIHRERIARWQSNQLEWSTVRSKLARVGR